MKQKGLMMFWDHLGCFCREIVDNHEKENALNIVTEERTYHIYAESPEDARYTIPTFSTLFIFALSACLCEKKKKINEWGQSSPLWTAVVFFYQFYQRLTFSLSDLLQLLVQCAESGPHCQSGTADGDASRAGQSQERRG